MPYRIPETKEARRARYLRRRPQVLARMRRYRELHLEKENARRRAWYKKNKSKATADQKAYAKAHPEVYKASALRYKHKKEADPVFRAQQAAKEKARRDARRDQYNANSRAYTKRRRETDANFVIKERLRARLYNKLKGECAAKAGKTFEMAGCTVDFLRGYLEARFKPGMTWKNIHIDHHIPCAEFDLRDPVQQKQCFHYSNLRPMWSAHNLSKGAKPPGIHQAELL